MRKIPTSVRISGVNWRICKVSDKHPKLEDASGHCCFKTQTIFLDKSYPPPAMWAVLTHELLHAISWGYHELDLTEETPVNAVAGELMNIAQQLGLLE